MDTKGWYNGYSWSERLAKFDEMKRLNIQAHGPCSICGDPTADVEFHDEDYSSPYIWKTPAAYCVCRHCHIYKIHSRFAHPRVWTAFLAHVRRGGYASDLARPDIKREIDGLKAALKNGETVVLKTLRPYKRRPEEEWFANLALDRTILTSPNARPRP
jgi:hypothetical protein